MYHAKLHPEQYCDTFSADEVKHLHASIRYVCQTAVNHLADSTKFPDEWLFKHRWGKGKKDAATTLPNGAKITFLTVGGRTSCVVPSVQKKTGAVAGDIKEKGDDVDNVDAKKGAIVKRTSKKRKGTTEKDDDEDEDIDELDPPAKKKMTGATKKVKDEDEIILPAKMQTAAASKKGLNRAKPEVVLNTAKGKAKKPKIEDNTTSNPSPAFKETTKKTKIEQPRQGRRRSGRASNGAV